MKYLKLFEDFNSKKYQMVVENIDDNTPPEELVKSWNAVCDKRNKNSDLQGEISYDPANKKFKKEDGKEITKDDIIRKLHSHFQSVSLGQSQGHYVN